MDEPPLPRPMSIVDPEPVVGPDVVEPEMEEPMPFPWPISRVEPEDMEEPP